MTVSAQVKQTLASLKGTRTTLDAFATIEENPAVKDVFDRNSKRIGQVIERMEKRLAALEFEEPQYKGF